MPDHLCLSLKVVNGWLDFYELFHVGCMINVIRKYNFGLYQFSVMPDLHEAETTLTSFSQKLFIAQNIATKCKTHTSCSTAFTCNIWWCRYWPPCSNVNLWGAVCVVCSAIKLSFYLQSVSIRDSEVKKIAKISSCSYWYVNMNLWLLTEYLSNNVISVKGKQVSPLVKRQVLLSG